MLEVRELPGGTLKPRELEKDWLKLLSVLWFIFMQGKIKDQHVIYPTLVTTIFRYKQV